MATSFLYPCQSKTISQYMLGTLLCLSIFVKVNTLYRSTMIHRTTSYD